MSVLCSSEADVCDGIRQAPHVLSARDIAVRIHEPRPFVAAPRGAIGPIEAL